MKIIHPFFERPIQFTENMVSVLVIEDPGLLSKVVWELHEQINEGVGKFILSDDHNELELKKYMDLTIDLFTLDFNQKRIINKVHNQLKGIAVSNDYYLDSCNLLGDIMRYIEEITLAVQYPLEYDQELDIGNVFKFANVKVATTHDTLMEKLMDYMALMQEFCGTRLFCFVNLKSFLRDVEVEMFYQFIAYRKFSILLLENSMREKVFNQEIIRIIDNDLCEI